MSRRIDRLDSIEAFSSAGHKVNGATYKSVFREPPIMISEAFLDKSSLCLMLLAEALTILLLFYRSFHRNLPIFTTYIGYLFVTTITLRILEVTSSDSFYWRAFVTQEVIQRSLEGLVLWEITSRILDEAHIWTTRAMMTLASITCASCVLCGLVIGRVVPFSHVTTSTQLFLRADLSAGVIEMILYLVLLIGTRAVHLRWKEPVVLILLCLFFYSLGWVGSRIFQEISQLEACECKVFDIADQIATILWCIPMCFLAWYLWSTRPAPLLRRLRLPPEQAANERN